MPLWKWYQIAARPGEAGDKAKPDRVLVDDEDDGDCRGCRLGRECGRRSCGRDHGRAPANQIGCQHRQSIDLTLRPAVFDRHVLALEIAGVLEALAKSTQTLRPPLGDVGLRNPIIGTADCCARALSGCTTAAPLARMMKSRRLMCSSQGLQPTTPLQEIPRCASQQPRAANVRVGSFLAVTARQQRRPLHLWKQP